MTKPKVAFICVHNSCRSQIAEALGKPYEHFTQNDSSYFVKKAECSFLEQNPLEIPGKPL